MMREKGGVAKLSCDERKDLAAEPPKKGFIVATKSLSQAIVKYAEWQPELEWWRDVIF